MNKIKCLSCLKPGECGKVLKLNTSGSMRRRFLDIGLIQNTLIECIGTSPSGDPSAFLIRGAVIAIRSHDSSDIIIESI